jgi:hypothetical protein
MAYSGSRCAGLDDLLLSRVSIADEHAGHAGTTSGLSSAAYPCKYTRTDRHAIPDTGHLWPDT